jgi:hypothetical protein
VLSDRKMKARLYNLGDTAIKGSPSEFEADSLGNREVGQSRQILRCQARIKAGLLGPKPVDKPSFDTAFAARVDDMLDAPSKCRPPEIRRSEVWCVLFGLPHSPGRHHRERSERYRRCSQSRSFFAAATGSGRCCPHGSSVQSWIQ